MKKAPGRVENLTTKPNYSVSEFPETAFVRNKYTFNVHLLCLLGIMLGNLDVQLSQQPCEIGIISPIVQARK
jgi:hypothetical protein